MENIVYESVNLTENIKNEMFDMYVKAYSTSGNILWFKHLMLCLDIRVKLL